MLTLELAGQSYNKTEHRRQLQRKLNNRSDASIEFKHSNISAAMIDLGFPYIRGYQPRSNYQALLADTVEAQIRSKTTLDQVALAAVEQPAIAPRQTDFAKVKSDAPKKQLQVSEAIQPMQFKATKRDYFEREARNRSLGLAGEEFVVLYEHWRLMELGQQRLADRVEHVSQSKGDGLGYDVLSFDSDGRERLIEVKTTTFGRDTPFFVSRGELALSKGAKEQFHLYRLFEFRKTPRLFALHGALDQFCNLDPVTYKASFA
ncbi:hypothetical protein RS694_00035 [Rhodoferax saidenbachensis]|uniref:Protein NO VEIN C-terminal domain-containing protein n=2 Tax=Rhodoferax saidenbachensis TaxID=1484693 RepID=A0A1P8KF75_9BURK|nr:hypothetical protein RS694_00035 [Rhodoferax saidenbachensis]